MMASTQSEHLNSTGHSGALYDGQQPSSSDWEQPLDLPPPGLQNSDDKQTVRHVLLCLLLSVSLLANLSSCLWWLFNKDPGRLYLELQFFCAVANYGQGFLSFGIFGLDKHLIIVPFKKRFLSLWHNRDGDDPSPSAVPEDVQLTCTQFVRYHKDQCVQDIVHTHRFGGVKQENGIGRCLSHHPQYLNTNPQRHGKSQNLHWKYSPDCANCVPTKLHFLTTWRLQMNTLDTFLPFRDMMTSIQACPSPALKASFEGVTWWTG